MDFFRIVEYQTKKDGYVIKPGFLVQRSKDLMVRGKSFYAVWDEENGLWSTDEFRLADLVDKELYAEKARIEQKTDQNVVVLSMRDFNGNAWSDWRRYLAACPDNFCSLDQRIKFANEKIEKEDYASFTLPYAMTQSPIQNYDHMMGVLYNPEEREKLEWAIGAIIAGDSVWIQKFIVLYGSAGSGKSTFLHILEQLFPGYLKSFEAKGLGQNSNQFAMESLRTNPLVAIQHDGDLSRIEDNTRLNSIVSHEPMLINEKHKSAYEITLHSFLFMGTNQPVKITDAKSGIIRRLINVEPTGNRLAPDVYDKCMDGIKFELGGIADHCLTMYKVRGPHYYDRYTPLSMMYQTDSFFNFVEEHYYDFCNADYVTLTRAWSLYKEYCESAALQYRLTMIKVKEELKSYFKEFYETKRFDGEQKRKVYIGFKKELFYQTRNEGRSDYNHEGVEPEDEDEEESELITLSALVLDSKESELDILLADCQAQYATSNDTPIQPWDSVTTTLKEIDTTRVHYVRPPENHIVIDFDLKDEDGSKDAKLNLEAAAAWPLTYAEFSKGGAGVHLHYIYDGDVSKLSSVYAPGIEVKSFRGKSALRRKLTLCNLFPIAHLSSGLPLKEDKKSMINFDRVMSEKGLRRLIERNLKKEIASSTKSSIDFIYNDLETAYNNGLVYDVRDLRPRILAFANNSSHQRDYCIRLVSKMKFNSEKELDFSDAYEDDALVAYDVESFKNVFIVCWKKFGEGNQVVKMINPTPNQIESLMRCKLISFNGRKYDGHMLMGRYHGETPYQLYLRSQKLVSNKKELQNNGYIREGFNVDYADVYDFSVKKQGLKKWEIELGIHHQENQYPWDEPLPEEHWDEVAEYCANDVRATEIVFNHLEGDFVAREILADIAGMPINTPTNTLTARIIFGNDKKPDLVYTNLTTGEQTVVKRKAG